MTTPERRSALPRPRRPLVPVAASLGLLAMWALVAQESGLGWVQSVGALVAGGLVVGLAGPALAVVRLRVTLEAAPSDAVRGTPCRLRLAVRGAGALTAVAPPGPPVLTGRSETVVLEVTPERRGLLDRVEVRLASAAPFGLMWWTRSVTLRLEPPVAVAPRPGAPDDAAMAVRPHGAGDAAGPGGGAAAGEQRGVRPYAPGDRAHLVHWPATAHTGALMTRERDRLLHASAVVDGLLPDDPAAAEVRAERVLGTVCSLLARGASVELRTEEPGGVVVGPVATASTAGRRLALALPRTGRPGRPR